MGMTILAGLIAAATLVQETDTAFVVQRGARLDVENFSGDIIVEAWSRDVVRVRAEHNARDRIEIQATGSVVSIRARARRGMPDAVDYAIQVPRWMRLNLNGVNAEIRVSGIEGDVTAHTIHGDVAVRGGSGTVSLHSVNGDVSLSGARGRVEAASVNGDVDLTDIEGDVAAETTNGDLRLERVDGASVEGTTVSGDVDFIGPIQNQGRYRFTTHSGDVTATVQEGANVTVSVATFSGEFESAFPLTLQEFRQGKRFQFTIGTGSARLDVESFSGTIQLRRPHR